ncbi:CW-type domain-containing protein [Heracleum sosnowskyi]|uniref:CW-type domain-containing protein n=1 Tax=Heracleum sosnowskyi TaxID=360622 RepID=A0AAD8MZF3_9APIA|nr:CW-type domain-containing protein [Heracleum sosnowskyi]
MAESELEEGEACYYKEDHADADDKTTFDPDKDLSYIDEKLQSVLGHFQKYFDGGVIVENQGAAFGGYGSFLPMHQRCPLVKSDPKTPQISQNYNRPRSPNNLHLESVPKNSLVPSKVPSSLKDGNTAIALHLHDQKSASLDGSTKLDPNLLRAQAAATVPARSESSSKKPGDQTDQKKIRLRIKVRSDCSAQKNAAIHRGLGLASPSSPVGHSPKDSGRDPSVSYTTLVESPSSILQYMTSFPDTGAMLLSPLHPRLLNLKAKKNNANNKLCIPIKVHQNDSAVSVDNPASKLIKDRKRKLVGGIGTVEEDNHGVGVNYVSNPISPARKHTTIETTEEKQFISSELKLKSLSSPACNSGESSNSVFRINQAKREAVKDVPPKKRIMKKDWVKDRIHEESVKLMHGCDGAKYDQQESKSGLMRIRGQGTKSSEKNISDDLRGGRAKGDRVYTLSKDQLDVSKRKKDSNSDVNNHPKQKVGLSFAQNKQDNLGQIEGLRKLPLDDKTKSKGRQSDRQLTSHLTDERFRPDNILNSKERPRKNVSKLPAGSEDMHDLRLQPSANKTDPLERSSRDCMTKDRKIEMGKENDVTDDIAQPDGQASESVDEWVQCDSCDTWRLLPYGVKSEQLPENWLCSMLDWLPGMNRCDILEGETTNAVLALRQPALPLPESNKFQSHVDQGATGVSSADVPSLNQDVGIHAMRNQGKKKHTAKEISAAVSSSGVIRASSLTKNSRESMKNRFLNDMNKPLPKANLISESTKCPDKFSDSSLGTSAGKQIDEGATKLKRLRLKREPDQSGYRTSKRVMTEGAVFNDDQRNPVSCGNPARMGHCSSAGLPPSTTWNNAQRHNEHLYSKDGNCELKDSVPISVKTLRIISPGISNSGCMGMKKNNESHGMKRKLKDRQECQNNLETFCSEENNLPDDEFMKEMKPVVSMTEGQESSACRGDAILNKKGKVTRIVLSGSRDSLTTTRHDQQQQKFSKSYKSKLTLDDILKLKEDLGCEQLSAAATSSSSKVSGSRKRSSNRKVRGSPVGSVSSSPLRSSNLAKVSLARRGSLGNEYGNTNIYSAGGAIQSLDHGSNTDQIGVGSRGEMSGVFQAESMSFPKLECQDHDVSGEADSNVKLLYDLKSKHVLTNNEDTLTQYQHSLTNAHSSDDCQSAERRNPTLNVANDTVLRIPGNNSCLLSEDIDKSSCGGEKVNMKPLDLSSGQGFKRNNDKTTAIRRSEYSQGDIKVKMLRHNCSNEKSVDPCSLDGRSMHEDKCRGEFAKPRNSTRAEMKYEMTPAHPHHAVKQETPTHVRQPVSVSLKGSGLDTRPSTGCRDVSKVLQQSKISVHQNGAHQVEGNHAVDQSMCLDTGIAKPVKGYSGGQAATDVLREAEDLKGHADHLKKSGFSFDSIMANFQAALKSLLGASLLESATSRSGRSVCGEIPQVQIYSSSAKLFETCAQDFGKHDEMYAAALAYKCTEVAYLRSIYSKSYMADKDRSDLQANLQMLPQGESPSSSASDVDSLYNQVTLDKTALLRGVASNAANDVTIVQNRPTIIRMLQFTHDMSSAMEASEKSRVAFEAAKEILKKGNGGATAVKRVLDSSFQDIEEFTRLVRLANEVICSSHI